MKTILKEQASWTRAERRDPSAGTLSPFWLSKIQCLKEKLLQQFEEMTGLDPHLLRLALNEAEALSWETGLPHLFFLTMAEEKVNHLNRWHERQAMLRAEAGLVSHAA